MVKWILNLSTQEMWLYGIVATAITGLFIAWFNQRLNHALATKRERRKNIVSASSAFRDAIKVETLKGLKGHHLHNALLGVSSGTGIKIEGEFFKHKKAIIEYRTHLGLVDRIRLDIAWKNYHGGNEEYPDFFKQYCIKENGPDTLVKRLKTLRCIGNKR